MTQQPTLWDAPAPPPVSPVATERQRLNAAALRVIQRLKEGPATNVQLSQPEIGGLRFGGRLFECKQDGWIIEKQQISGGLWLYRLAGLR